MRFRPFGQPPRLFQSAPRDCSRGDTYRSVRIGDLVGFNPRLAIAREATEGVNPRLQTHWVSIRASRLLARRLSGVRALHDLIGFNPRLAIAREATRVFPLTQYHSFVSIRASRLLARRRRMVNGNSINSGSFNPRLAIAREATAARRSSPQSAPVSFRASRLLARRLSLATSLSR